MSLITTVQHFLTKATTANTEEAKKQLLFSTFKKYDKGLLIGQGKPGDKNGAGGGNGEINGVWEGVLI